LTSSRGPRRIRAIDRGGPGVAAERSHLGVWLFLIAGFEDVFALDPVDIAVSKVSATARSRWALRLGRGGSDRGLKDINTIAGLIKAGRIERSILASRLAAMDYEPALMVECGRVMEEILGQVDV